MLPRRRARRLYGRSNPGNGAECRMGRLDISNSGVLSPNHEDCDGVKDGVEGHAEIDHAQFYSEISDDAEEYLNSLTSDDVWFGSSESGDWGLWHICDADNNAPEHCKVCDY